MREIRSPGSVRGVPGDGDSYREPNLLLRPRISLRLKAFPCPATSEGSNTLSPAVLWKGTDTQQPTLSRYEVWFTVGIPVAGDPPHRSLGLPGGLAEGRTGARSRK